MNWEDLACLIKTLFIAVVLLIIIAFLGQVFNSSDVKGQEVRPTPPATTPAPTNTPPPTLVPTPTPTGDAPTMDVNCAEDHDTWLCTAWVYPGYIAGLEVLAVESYGDWPVTLHYLGDVPDGWGVVVRWHTIPSCITEFAELRLIEMESTTVRVQQSPPWFPTPSPIHARYSVGWHCTFLPEVQ